MGLFCSQLPPSDLEQSDFKGIYGISSTYLSFNENQGWHGKSHGIRSVADVSMVINGRKVGGADYHRPAEEAMKHIGIGADLRYRAKLGSGLYDTTSSNYEKSIGEFVTFNNHPVSYHEVNEGEVNFSLSIESDGTSVGREKDDVSRIGIKVAALPTFIKRG